jgi:hypothetical protein
MFYEGFYIMKKMGIMLGVAGCAVGLVLILTQRKEEEPVTARSSTSVADQKPDERIAIINESRTVAGPAQESMKPLDEQQLSEPVKALLLRDEAAHNYPSLLAEINKLNYTLSIDDIAALIDMLAWPNDRFPEGMRAIEINAVKNDVLDKLLRQETLPEGIGIAMAAMAADPNQDIVWRDYCVQFMAPFYERAAGEQTTEYTEGDLTAKERTERKGNSPVQNSPVNSELQVIQDAMFQALDERDSTLAGTALIGLENLSRTYDEFDREVISEKAAQIASDELASSESRMTALRLSAQILNSEGISNVEVVQAARTLAQTGETVLLRSAAIVTLGEVGSTDDRELLESYLLADNRQIAGAAKMALEKMSARN